MLFAVNSVLPAWRQSKCSEGARRATIFLNTTRENICYCRSIYSSGLISTGGF